MNRRYFFGILASVGALLAMPFKKAAGVVAAEPPIKPSASVLNQERKSLLTYNGVTIVCEQRFHLETHSVFTDDGKYLYKNYAFHVQGKIPVLGPMYREATASIQSRLLVPRQVLKFNIGDRLGGFFNRTTQNPHQVARPIHLHIVENFEKQQLLVDYRIDVDRDEREYAWEDDGVGSGG